MKKCYDISKKIFIFAFENLSIMSYTPPYSITTKTVKLIAEISEKIGAITALSDNPLSLQLRRENRIKTIHSSLAIESNTLSIQQITDIIDGSLASVGLC